MPMVHIDMRGTLHMVAWADGESVSQHLGGHFLLAHGRRVIRGPVVHFLEGFFLGIAEVTLHGGGGGRTGPGLVRVGGVDAHEVARVPDGLAFLVKLRLSAQPS